MTLDGGGGAKNQMKSFICITELIVKENGVKRSQPENTALRRVADQDPSPSRGRDQRTMPFKGSRGHGI